MGKESMLLPGKDGWPVVLVVAAWRVRTLLSSLASPAAPEETIIIKRKTFRLYPLRWHRLCSLLNSFDLSVVLSVTVIFRRHLDGWSPGSGCGGY